MSERSDAIKYGANPAVIDKYFIEFHGRLFHKFCCCGCGSRVGKGSAVIKDTTFEAGVIERTIRSRLARGWKEKDVLAPTRNGGTYSVTISRDGGIVVSPDGYGE